MRRIRLIVVAVALSLAAALVPTPAQAFKCAEIKGVGDPCTAVCQLLGPIANKTVLCRLT